MTQSSHSPLHHRRRPAHSPTDPPRLLGNWQLQQVIGQGAYTQVYAARPLGCPPSRPADYAIKLLSPQYAQDPVAWQLLRREAEVGRTTSHPHLVPILETHLDTAQPHLVMPRLQGASLQQALDGVGVLVLSQALWLTRQVAQALQHLHQQGWVHGDVKPANIVVSRQGHATLIDLGSSLRLAETSGGTARSLAGSLAYLAPELLNPQALVSSASDVYSLGVTLYQMLSGTLPYQEPTPARLVQAHREDRVPDLAALRPEIPEEVAEFVHRMMDKVATRRPSTEQTLIDGLAELEIETLQSRFRDDWAA